MNVAPLLDAIGWPPSELAKRLGVSNETVRGWVSGRRRAPAVVHTWLEDVGRGVASAGPAPAQWDERT